MSTAIIAYTRLPERSESEYLTNKYAASPNSKREKISARNLTWFILCDSNKFGSCLEIYARTTTKSSPQEQDTRAGLGER